VVRLPQGFIFQLVPVAGKGLRIQALGSGIGSKLGSSRNRIVGAQLALQTDEGLYRSQGERR